MRIPQFQALLSKAFQTNLTVLAVGAPGIGKTEAVQQAAKSARAKMVITYAGLADPTNALGFPWISPDGKSANFVPFGETLEVLNFKPDKEYDRIIWFWDDLGQGSPAVQASFMPWALARKVNGRTLPPQATIIAATNRREDRAGVSGILEPVKSRFAMIVHIQANVDDWGPWFASAGGAPEILAYLRYKRDDLHQFEPKAEIENQPSPRTWWHASEAFRMNLSDPELLKDAITGAVGPGAAAGFIGYLRIYQTVPDLDKVIANPKAAPVPNDPAVLWGLVTGLASKATVANFGKISEYSRRLADAGQEEYAVVLARDSVRRTPKIESGETWQKLMLTEVGRLVAGEY